MEVQIFIMTGASNRVIISYLYGNLRSFESFEFHEAIPKRTRPSGDNICTNSALQLAKIQGNCFKKKERQWNTVKTYTSPWTAKAFAKSSSVVLKAKFPTKTKGWWAQAPSQQELESQTFRQGPFSILLTCCTGWAFCNHLCNLDWNTGEKEQIYSGKC